jgi:predicted molibdopterin-dependent oxidoreductase YjgC
MTRVGTFDGLPLSEHECKGCGECVKVCPVGALYLKSSK